MNLQQLKSTMKTYGRAWENQDSDLLLSIFAKDGVYQESPLAKTIKGHKKIANFWNQVVGEETKNIRFKLGKCYISSDKKVGFAEWECKNAHKWKKDMKWRQDHMAGIMIIKMKGNKISHLNEYWRTKSK
ncbi:MAG: nuclear transport factor 2 family protein [archaeon]